MALLLNRCFIVPAKLTPGSSVIRNLICSPVSDGSAPADSSVLVQNVPPLINEKNLIAAFKSVASVQSVTLVSDEKNSFVETPQIGYNKAVVVFKEDSGLTALKEGKFESPLVLSIPLTDARLLTPIAMHAEQAKQHQEHAKTMREKADEIVKLYDEGVRLKTKMVKSYSGEVDEEGWQVVRRIRPDSLNREKALLTRMKLKEEKKKRIEGNVAQVYQYRMRNEKLGKLRQLRKKFEEDKFKIAQMRAGRKFKPM